MPFSKTTWALIFITIFGWPLVLSLIDNDFKWKNMLKDFDALFVGWAMILEQSHFRAANYKERSGCVILAIFILSNAFKGDNIQVLAKSFELVSLTHMDQIIRAGYKTYSINVCLRRSEFYSTGRTDKFYMEADRRRHQYTDKQYKLWEPTGNEVVYLAPEPTQVKVEFFENCQRQHALLD